MADLNIPSSLDEITPDWLTEALRSTGVIDGASVAEVQVEPLAAGVGFTTQMATLQVRYSGDANGAPSSIFCKLPTQHGPTLEVAKDQGFFEREVRFYQKLSEDVGIRVPQVYHAALDPESAAFVLLLEDLAPARCGDQVAGCSTQEAELAIGSLAAMHAQWWDSPELPSAHPWLLPRLSIQKDAQQAYPDHWQAFKGRFEAMMSPEVLSVGDMLGDHVTSVKERLNEPPATLCQGDFRLDNLFFGDAANDFGLAAVDWQACRYGRGTAEVAYFLTCSLDPAARAAHEDDLLRTYHRGLQEGGVSGYTLDDVRLDYRLSILDRFSFYVSVVSVLDFSSRRSVRLARATLNRYFAAVADNHVGDLLPLR